MEDWANWVTRGDGCYFVERPGLGRSAVSYFDFASGRSTTLFETPKVIQRNSGLSVSPDGSSILFTQEDRVESDVVRIAGFAGRL